MTSLPSYAAIGQPRYRAWYLGEAWAVIDHAAAPKIVVVGDRDYASARSAERAAKRLNEKDAASC